MTPGQDTLWWHTGLPFQGGRVEFTLLLKLLEEPGLDESAPPCHDCYAIMLAHAPACLQAALTLPLPPCTPALRLCLSLSATATLVKLLLSTWHMPFRFVSLFMSGAQRLQWLSCGIERVSTKRVCRQELMRHLKQQIVLGLPLQALTTMLPTQVPSFKKVFTSYGNVHVD